MPSRSTIRFAFPVIALLLSASGARAQVYYFSDPGTPVVYRSFYPIPQASHVTREYHSDYTPYGNDEDSEGGTVVRGGSQPLVQGDRAIVRHGVAYAPEAAPECVKQAIWSANTLRHKPYKWGGGHGSFFDSGYDCSGTVCFALHGAGLLASPIPSSDLRGFGERGRGRWITIYSRAGHTFAMIAGLRLDTTGYYGTEGPRWHADGRDTWGYEARHPAGL